MAYKNIEVSFDNGLGSITLNRPPVNVLNIEMMEEMNDALGAWLNEKDLKVLLINAKGKCFSAGVDVGEFAVVGAGSVVTRDIPRGKLAVGVPARIVADVRMDGTPVEEST